MPAEKQRQRLLLVLPAATEGAFNEDLIGSGSLTGSGIG